MKNIQKRILEKVIRVTISPRAKLLKKLYLITELSISGLISFRFIISKEDSINSKILEPLFNSFP